VKRWLLPLLLALPVLAAANDTEIRNVTMSPASPATNSDVTICFDVRNTGGATSYVSVGFADSGYVFNCNTVNQVNWVLDDRGVYRGGSLTVSGTSQAVTSNNYTDVVGPNGGVNVGTTTGTNWKQVCIQTHIPPEFSGNYTVIVAPSRDGLSELDLTCGTCQQANTAASFGYTNFTVTGSPLVKLNLEVCNAGACTTGAICWEYKVTNWGESGVRVTGLAMKFCYYDTNYNWEAQGSSNAQAYLPSGATYCNTYNPSEQYSFTNFSTVDCGPDGKANQCYNYTIKGGPINQSMPYYDPPAGGSLQSQSPPIWFRPIPNVLPTTTDDYANLNNAATCGSGWSSIPHIALYNNGSLVCEWSSSVSTDNSTGVPHCGSTGGCNNCPAGGVSNMARNSTGPSNVVCLNIYSPTPTPVMQLTKVADRAVGLLGDTITYTITWKNNASAARTMTIWDTVPFNTTYVGCNNACTQSGGVVTWNLGSQAAGATGTVQFWVTVSALPYLPGWLEQRQALAPPAPRSRELMLGLWSPLAARSGRGAVLEQRF
jgi:uncharacterized repeat protein (TIGR01451 family)